MARRRKVELDRAAWAWCEEIDPDHVTDENIAAAYRLNVPKCGFGNCRFVFLFLLFFFKNSLPNNYFLISNHLDDVRNYCQLSLYENDKSETLTLQSILLKGKTNVKYIAYNFIYILVYYTLVLPLSSFMFNGDLQYHLLTDNTSMGQNYCLTIFITI